MTIVASKRSTTKKKAKLPSFSHPIAFSTGSLKKSAWRQPTADVFLEMAAVSYESELASSRTILIRAAIRAALLT
jgi:hypothetical protein